jgi:asparagine synthase (glutamine-hydrolysing)
MESAIDLPKSWHVFFAPYQGYLASSVDSSNPVRHSDPGAIQVAGSFRLDNEAELRQRLDLPVSSSPAAIIAAAYRAWGTDFPAYLLGDFSLALMDPGQGRLLLVRDHLGIRPLYYHIDHRGCFASDDLDTLLAQTARAEELNETLLAEWCLRGRVYHQTETFFRGIHKVPKATVISVTQGCTTDKTYWSLDEVEPLDYAHEATYAEHLRELLQRVIDDRLTGIDGFAAHASGGLDSTPIAIMAGRRCRAAGQVFHTFNWCRPGPDDAREHYEWADTRRIADMEGFQHEEIGVTVDSLKASWLHHDITRQGTTMLEYEKNLLPRAQLLGVHTIFSGFGGDEFLTARTRNSHSDLVRSGHWAAVYHRLRLESAPNTPGWRLAHRLARTLYRGLLPFQADFSSWSRTQKSRESAFQRFVRPDLVRHAQPDTGMVAWHRAESLPERRLALIDEGYHQERIETWSALARPYGIRHVYPLLDRRIVEFAHAMPTEWYFRHGQARYLYRQALVGILPAFLIDVPKRPERRRIQQLQQARIRALSDPDILDHIASSRSPHIDTQRLLAACRQLAASPVKPVDEPSRPARTAQLQAMITAILALNVSR